MAGGASSSLSPTAGSGGGMKNAEIEMEEANLLPPDSVEQLTPRTRAAYSMRRSNTTTEAAQSIFSSYLSRRFMSGCAVLLPIVLTVYIMWWFLEFFDGFFSPLYDFLFGFHVFGLGFLTTMFFVFGVGVFTSTWLGSVTMGMGEYIIRRLPLVKHIYSAAKQVSAAVSPDNEQANSFRECVIIRHPRRDGEFAFAFITGQTVLQTEDGDETLYCCYIPTNHVYVGDIFLLPDRDIIRNNLSVREGLEIVVSVGMAVPPRIIAMPTPLKR
ncbi:Protein LIKE COV 2 [Chlorella vulgaris]